MCDYRYMVYIQCMTYNQAAFVVDTLNGFCKQETNFPYVCCIIDDCSTDGEQDVIKGYVLEHFDLDDHAIVKKEENQDYSLLFARHKTNQNCFFSVLFLKYNHYGKKSKIPYTLKWRNVSKYTATCEGDDYWTASYKLQKQVNFLENHSEYALTCHRYSIYDQEDGRLEEDGNENMFKDGADLSFDLRIKLLTKTLTLLFRTDAIKEYDNYPGTQRDTVIVYFVLKNGLGYCFNENMGVYRRSFNGVCGKKDKETNALARLKIRKELYLYEKNSFTRQAYYRFLFQALYITPRKALKEMLLNVAEFKYIPYYLFKEIIHISSKRDTP